MRRIAVPREGEGNRARSFLDIGLGKALRTVLATAPASTRSARLNPQAITGRFCSGKCVGIADGDRIAADLHRKLRGPDDGRTNTLAGIPDRRQVAALRQHVRRARAQDRSRDRRSSVSRACRDIRRRRRKKSARRVPLLASSGGHGSVTSSRCDSSSGARRSIMRMMRRTMRAMMRSRSCGASGCAEREIDAKALRDFQRRLLDAHQTFVGCLDDQPAADRDRRGRDDVPFSISANLVVPPPISTLSNVAPWPRDKATAPEPCAAIWHSM